MLSYDSILDQLFVVTDLMFNAICPEEAELYERCAYSCSIAVMMMDGDLSDLPVAERS